MQSGSSPWVSFRGCSILCLKVETSHQTTVPLVRTTSSKCLGQLEYIDRFSKRAISDASRENDIIDVKETARKLWLVCLYLQAS